MIEMNFVHLPLRMNASFLENLTSLKKIPAILQPCDFGIWMVPPVTGWNLEHQVLISNCLPHTEDPEQHEEQSLACNAEAFRHHGYAVDLIVSIALDGNEAACPEHMCVKPTNTKRHEQTW